MSSFSHAIEEARGFLHNVSRTISDSISSTLPLLPPREKLLQAFSISPLSLLVSLAVLSLSVYFTMVRAARKKMHPPPTVSPLEGGLQPQATATHTPKFKGDLTEEELKAYDGKDETKPLLMAVRGKIYDMSMSRQFYGPGGPYAVFAGHDATRALALMSTDPADVHADVTGLSASELDTLSEWESKFQMKYDVVGKVVAKKDEPSSVSGETSSMSGETSSMSGEASM